LNRIEADEAVVFADAAGPTHAVRPIGCWGRKTFPSRSNKAVGGTG
jgi:hypothetical protein